MQPARDRAAVIDDVVQRDRHRGVVALDHHAERIADQHQVDAGVVDQRREAGVVGGDGRRSSRRSAFIFIEGAQTLTGGRGA